MSSRHVTPEQLEDILDRLEQHSPTLAFDMAVEGHDRWDAIINDKDQPTGWGALSPRWVATKEALVKSGRVQPDPAYTGGKHKGLLTGALKDSAGVSDVEQTPIGHRADLLIKYPTTSYEGVPITVVFDRLQYMKGQIFTFLKEHVFVDARNRVVDNIRAVIS
jgi:hypothetical protein